MNLQHIQGTLIHEIQKYSNLPCTDNDSVGDQLDAPYIALNFYGTVESLSNSATFPVSKVHYQIKAVTEGGTPNDNPQAKAQCENIADWLRRFWFLEQPKEDLLNANIKPVQPVGTLGLNAIYLGNFNQFQDGADLTLAVYNPINDDTQPGRIEKLRPSFTDKTIEKRKG